MKIKVAISMGDYNGIGPEVIIKSLAKQSLNEITPILLGNQSVFDYYLNKYGLSLPLHRINDTSQIKNGLLNIWNTSLDSEVKIEPGVLTRSAGKASMLAVEKGIDLCLNRGVDALVTAPISKEAVHLAGYDIPGHTEFLADRTKSRDYMMILASGGLRVGLVTGHIPLSQVASVITPDMIIDKIKTLNQSLQKDFGIPSPRIAVFGLNPHAGDGGVLGSEEETIIGPAIRSAIESGIQAEGPFPADGFFGNSLQNSFDGIVAMYHDQGLVPFKTLSFGSGVNFTAGLPIIRTSPDHGTAFNIAGKNIADEKSLSAAIDLAVHLSKNRKISAAE
jgi:4-hydroxythreonine-4-phosphate dehydrogenase